jgi:hypothetical protein
VDSLVEETIRHAEKRRRPPPSQIGGEQAAVQRRVWGMDDVRLARVS